MGRPQGIGNKEIGIANYIDTIDIDPESTIYAPKSIKNMVYSLTGVPVYTEIDPIYGDLLSSEDDYLSLLFTLKYLNIRYIIVLANELKSILEYFPLDYEDDYYKIYKLPEYSIPNIMAERRIPAGEHKPNNTNKMAPIKVTPKFIDIVPDMAPLYTSSILTPLHKIGNIDMTRTK